MAQKSNRGQVERVVLIIVTIFLLAAIHIPHLVSRAFDGDDTQYPGGYSENPADMAA